MVNYNVQWIEDIEKAHEIFKELYECSALTNEGCIVDDENMEFLSKWLIEKGAQPVDGFVVYAYKGEIMNCYYGLTGENAYPDDLNIISIKPESFGNPSALTVARFELEFRWFDDLVDGNLYREGRY